MEHFNYKGGCGIHVTRDFEKELAWAVVNSWFISYVTLLKTVILLRN